MYLTLLIHIIHYDYLGTYVCSLHASGGTIIPSDKLASSTEIAQVLFPVQDHDNSTIHQPLISMGRGISQYQLLSLLLSKGACFLVYLLRYCM